MEKFVSCVTRDQCFAVIRRMEAEGCRPINPDHAWSSYSKEVVIRKNNDKHISYANRQWYTDHGYGGRIITAYQYLNKTNKPILITRKGRVVTAEDKNTGDKAIATCCPTDTFDFGTGAMIAVARLIAQSDKGITKDAEVVLRQLLGYNAETPAEKHKAKVGDKLIIREWDEMRDNEDRDSVGNIFSRNDPQGCFSTAMKSISGKTVVITELDEEDDDRFRIVPSGFPNAKKWWVRRWMVKEFITDESPADEEPTVKFKIGDLVTLKDGLEVGKPYGAVDLLEIMYSNGYGKPMRVTDTTKCEDGDMAYDCAPVSGGRSFWYVEEMLETWDSNKIHEGDKVHVKKGCTEYRYDTYYKWLKDNISDVDLLLGFERRESISTADVYTVVKIAPHEYFTDGQLALIKRTDEIGNTYSYLFNINGLEKVTE